VTGVQTCALPISGLRVRLELVSVHGHVGELLGDEVAVGRDDHEDREDSQHEQQDRGEHDGHESTDGGAVLSPVRLRAVSTPAPSPRTWLMLFGAICAEVTGTMALRATVDSAAWLPLVPAAYLVCFLLLALVLRTGMPIGVAYGIWGAAGVSLTAVLGAVLFDEFLSGAAIAGIGLIIVGVVLVETGSRTVDDDEVVSA